MAQTFTRNQFTPLRAIMTFKLGSIDQDIHKDDVVEYDGVTVKIGEEKHIIPAFASAVRIGWLVPIDDTTTEYRPQSANIEVHPAISTSKNRGEQIDVRTVHDEERNVGSLKQVRDRGDGIVRKKMALQVEEGSGEGVVVGRVARPTHVTTQIDARNSMRIAQEIHRMDDVKGRPDATGARVIQSNNELFDEGVVVGTVKTRKESLGEGIGHPASTENIDPKVIAEANRLARLKSIDAVKPDDSTEADGVEEVLSDDLGQKIVTIRAVIPNFEWDMTRPWKTRVLDAVKRYGKNKLYLSGILSVETDTVKASIRQKLDTKSPAA